MYACSPGAFAYVSDGDPNAGGVYAQALIDVAIKWAERKRPERLSHPILSVVGAHDLAKRQVEMQTEGDQTPKYPISEDESVLPVLRRGIMSFLSAAAGDDLHSLR